MTVWPGSAPTPSNHVCGWHSGGGPYLWQWWKGLPRGSFKTMTQVPGQEPHAKELIVDFRRTLQHQRTHHWGLMGLLWRGWATTGTWESTSQRIWLGLHTLTLWWERVSSASTTSGSWGNSKSPGGEHPDRKNHCLVRQQLLSGQKGSAEGSEFGWTHYWHYTPHPAGPVFQEVSNQSL